MKTKKLLRILLFVTVVSLVMSVSVLAEDHSPTPVLSEEVLVGEGSETDVIDWDGASAFFTNLGVVILTGILVAVTTERGTEAGKLIARFAAKSKLTRWLYIHGTGSTALGVLTAFLAVYQFDVQLLERFELIKASLDPELLRIFSVVAIWVGSSLLHAEMPEQLQWAKKVNRYGGAKSASPPTV